MIIKIKAAVLSVLLFLFSQISFAQGPGQYYPAYDTAKDRPWLDSLKKIVQKGDVPDEKQYGYGEDHAPGDKRYWQHVFNFMNSCTSLALYYEKLFDRKNIGDMHLSIRYLKRIIDMNNFPDEGPYEKASAVRITAYRKLADIYYRGKGVNKNLKYSEELALSGIAHNPVFFDLYSKRYNYRDYMVPDKAQIINYNSDTLFSFTINPFAWKIGLFTNTTLQKAMDPIAKAFIRRHKTEGFTMRITTFPEASSRDQTRAYRLMVSLVKYFCYNKKINQDMIATEADVQSDWRVKKVEILFTK